VHIDACHKPPWVIIDPVNAARFMTAASTLQRLARSAALNAPCAARQSRIGTPLGFPDIGSSPVQLRNPNDSHPKRIGISTSWQNRFTDGTHAHASRTHQGVPRVVAGIGERGRLSWRPCSPRCSASFFATSSVARRSGASRIFSSLVCPRRRRNRLMLSLRSSHLLHIGTPIGAETMDLKPLGS
jgi:hypothetical protein